MTTGDPYAPKVGVSRCPGEMGSLTLNSPLKILLELRPALGGHAGIPQATRLLFRCLAPLKEFQISGLLQSSERLLTPGLPVSKTGWFRRLTPAQEFNRLGRVVIAIEESKWNSYISATALTIAMALHHIVGGRQSLSRFEAGHFRDFIWRRFFSQTLPPDDFDAVTHAKFRIARIPWIAMHICALITRKLGYSLYPRLNTSDFDIMITETPYPATVSKRTKLIIRYHDAIPLLMPHTISDRRFHQSFHYHALCKNVASNAWFACVSEATRSDLLSIFPQAEPRAVTIHNMVSHDYYREDSNPDRVPEIIRTRFNTRVKPPLSAPHRDRLFSDDKEGQPLEYVMIVSTIEPRKNHLSLLTAWEMLRLEKFPSLKIVIVGALGWHHKNIIKRFRVWIERLEVVFLEDVPAAELRVLYRQSRAVICPSFGEGFDYSGVEAMKSGGAVVASNIPVHREVYSEAAEYFNPYSVHELSHAIANVISPANFERRQELISKGALVSTRYDYNVIVPKWRALFHQAGSGR